MKKNYILIGCISAIFLSAQTQKSFRLPSVNSPESLSLGKFGDYPVGLNTGTVNIEIPLFNIKSGDIEIPLSISYHTGGIRVDQESSSIGLGWNLNAGGVITRTIKDKDDFAYDGFTNLRNQLPDYNSISQDNPIGTVPYFDYGNQINNPLDVLIDQDTNPDIFSINSNLLNGSFAMDNNGNMDFLEFSDLKLNYNYKNDNTERIRITDSKGYIYVFGKSEIGDKAIEESTNEFNSIISANPPGNIPTIRTEPKYISAWWLTDIISPSGKKVLFKYKEYSYQNSIISSSAKYSINATGTTLGSVDAIGHNFEGEAVNYLRSFVNSRIIDKIIFDEGTVEFNHLQDRQDIYQTSNSIPRIEGLTVYNNSQQVIKKITFENNDYFQRTGNGSMYTKQISSFERKSLRLNSLKFINKDGAFDSSYLFDYDQTPLPPRNTAGQDYWGYYNGKHNSSLIPDYVFFGFSGNPIYVGNNKDTDINFMKAASLKKITYPSRGYTTYDFEPNYYIKKDKNGQPTIQKTKTIKLMAMANSSKCVNNPELPGSDFTGLKSKEIKDFYVIENVISPLRVSLMFSDYEITQGQPMLFNVDTGSQSRLYKHIPSEKSHIKTFNEDLSLYTGSQVIMEANTNGVGGNSQASPCNTPFIDGSVSYDYTESATPQQVVPQQAGGLRVKEIKSYNENGDLITKKNYVYGETAYGVNNIYVGKLISDPRANIYKQKSLYYNLTTSAGLQDIVWVTSNSLVELGMNNGCPIDYNKVTEYIESVQDALQKKKIEYYFTGLQPNILPSSSQERPYDTYIYPEWKKSLPTHTIYYKNENGNFNKTREEKFKYYSFSERRIKNLIINERGDEFEAFDGNYFIKNKNRYWVANMYLPLGKKVLSEKETSDYFDINGSSFFSTTFKYLYNNPSYQLTKEQTIFSNNIIKETNFSYAFEKNNQLMLDKNMVSIPLETTVTQTIGNTTKTLSKTETKYPLTQAEANTKTSGLALPTSVLSYDLQNLAASAASTEVTYDNYDNKGNLQQYTTKDGVSTTIIWGYNQTQPIAKLEGAKLSDITQSLITSIVNASNADAANPSQEPALLTALDNFRKSSTLSAYQITTYTYDPLIGVTSITPPSGIRERYIYDSANRLEKIVDVNDNILKEFKYNYKN